MPIYEYQCLDCGHIFSKLSRSVQSSEESPAIPCPECGSENTQRIVSNVAVLDGLGGLTPGEQAAQNKVYEKQASILPKSKIDEYRKAKKGK
jgi:putative FmdB family regulatory protein